MNHIDPATGNLEFSILVPVFNSEQSLGLVIEGVRDVFSDIGSSYELVLVDDGSTDRSWEIIEQEHPKGDICAVRLTKNQGHSVALKRGLEFCQGQWVVTMDDDLQHPPSELPKLINAAREMEDVDVIMGAYDSQRGQLHKSLGARLYQYVLRNAFSLPDDLVITSFRAIHRRVVDEIVARNIASPHAGFMILAASSRIVNVEVVRHPRRYGESGMSMKKSITALVDSLLLNSELPLKVIGFGGLSMSLLALLLAAYYAVKYFVGQIGVSGFTTTVLLIIGFSGLILGSISVVGLYIMRLLQQVTFSPRYSLRAYLPRPGGQDP